MIDRTQPVPVHQNWRCVVRPPEIEDRSCRRIDDGLQTELVVRQAGQRRIAVVQPTKHQ